MLRSELRQGRIFNVVEIISKLQHYKVSRSLEMQTILVRKNVSSVNQKSDVDMTASHSRSQYAEDRLVSLREWLLDSKSCLKTLLSENIDLWKLGLEQGLTRHANSRQYGTLQGGYEGRQKFQRSSRVRNLSTNVNDSSVNGSRKGMQNPVSDVVSGMPMRYVRTFNVMGRQSHSKFSKVPVKADGGGIFSDFIWLNFVYTYLL